MSVYLKQDTHEYFDQIGNKYDSVTTILKSYTPKFDQDGSIAKNYAKKHGMTVEEVNKLWSDKGRVAAENGTILHEELELYVLTGDITGKWSQRFHDLKLGGTLQTEQILSNKDSLIAGTVDLPIIVYPGIMDIGDHKSNAKINMMNIKGERLLAPFDHLQNCHHVIYSLQLNMYKYMVEQQSEYEVRDLFILHYDRDSDKINIIKALPLDQEVKYIFEKRKKKFK